ncbi:MAG: sporulation integral membrane protein YlbJ [Candidatus Cohnella colombiensis]|uniref:Sporulation integral membrane protein YlbJ n=1 Tax=Candidatus Cohnella colombiensis TaxID=3121368 RepID=A0AA95JAZ7_9BACL|nr:MAG: sporulation integral membrane protein YlbJ [Cohnella sp.]
MRSIQSNAGASSRWLLLIGVFSLGGISLLLASLALAMPDHMLTASLRGVAVWWEVLFPALFPFFVLSEILLGVGVVHFVGTLLDPFMRPLFRLPGIGGFVVAMGFASGYPIGARLTSQLMEQNLLTREQGERLVTITTTSDPIFLIGAVCIGFFGNVHLAPIIAITHYGTALLIGIFASLRTKDTNNKLQFLEKSHKRSFKAALAAMHRARLADGRTFSTLLQQALQSSLALIVIVGGLVVFFSATLELLMHSGLLSSFRQLIASLLQLFGSSPQLAPAIVNGTFEVTLGAKAAAAHGTGVNTSLPLVDQVAIAGFILSWAGLSVHAQVAGLMSRTTWRYLPFARDRFIHGVLTLCAVYIVWPFFNMN